MNENKEDILEKMDLSPEELASLKEEMQAAREKLPDNVKSVKLDPDDLDAVAGGADKYTQRNCQHNWQEYYHGFSGYGTEITCYWCDKCGAEAWHKRDYAHDYWQYSYDY